MSTAIEHPTAAPTAGGPRRRILTRPLLMVYLSGFCAMVSFYLLLSVVPVYATSVGAGRTGAGFTTGALMLSTVVAELFTPRLIARFGYRTTLAAGLLLLGAPALALPAARSLATIAAVCLVRGVGFAIIVVAGGALMAALVPSERRGEGLGLAGVVFGVPAMTALPLGVALASRFGTTGVFLAGGLAALPGLAAVPCLPRFRRDKAGRDHHNHPSDSDDRDDPSRAAAPLGVLAGFRTPALLRPALAFSTSAMAVGVVVTFLPVRAGASSGGIVAVALLLQAGTSTLARWWAGRHGDRHGAARMLAPGLVVAAAGMLTLAVGTAPVVVLLAMVLFGTGFGVAQSATLSVMFAAVPESGYGTASALWNLAYDGAVGAGGAGFGLIVAQTGFQAGFAITAVPILLALLLCRRAGASLEASRPSPAAD
jgi:predicted MFS family arabinose efflux permease